MLNPKPKPAMLTPRRPTVNQAKEISARDIDPKLDLIVFLEERCKQAELQKIEMQKNAEKMRPKPANCVRWIDMSTSKEELPAVWQTAGLP